jgi:(2Fe-2S) ferredoxin
MTVTTVVCRGCCCGSSGKHPGVDHAAQLEQMSRRSNLVRSACLEMCEHSNVMVVLSGERVTWLGSVLAAHDTEAVADWLDRGAPPPVPVSVEHLVVGASASGVERLESVMKRLERTG